MKTIKSKFLAFIAIAIIFSAGIAKADNNEPSTLSSLEAQIHQEIVDVLKTPLWLNYQDKNLKGDVNVVIAVGKNGKVSLVSVKGENNVLNSMVGNKIKSRNLWTDTKYAGKTFIYKVVSK